MKHTFPPLRSSGLTRSISSRSAIADIPSPPPIREERRMLAIGLRLLAVICLAIMFAAVKVAGQRGVHVVETLFYRQFLALPLILGRSEEATTELPSLMRFSYAVFCLKKKT